jgi:lipoate-protein ligase A
MPDTRSLLILPYRRAAAAAQMALDASLLSWAARGDDRAVFRTYGWARPTLSLGRAEPYPQGWDEGAIRDAGIDVVRRPTGGDAVLHDAELTFAVAVALPGPWRLRPRGFADLVADALAGALRESGLEAERTLAAGSMAEPGARPGLHPCFARTAPGEVRVGRFKVAGIASRFTRGAALSHASVPLSGAFRDVARFRLGAGHELEHEALEAGARSASELLSGHLHEEWIVERLAPELARALHVTPRHTEFDDVGLEDPLPAAAGSAHR